MSLQNGLLQVLQNGVGLLVKRHHHTHPAFFRAVDDLLQSVCGEVSVFDVLCGDSSLQGC
jgi:hypothetical protein